MSYRRSCHRFYGTLKRTLLPTMMSAPEMFGTTVERYVRPGIDWLDVGCGHRILANEATENKLVARSRTVVGLDRDFSALVRHRSIRLRILGDLTSLPISDESVDLVTASMVVEHLDDPVVQLREAHRVLRPSGVLLFHTPNALGYMTVLARLVPESLKPGIIRFLHQRETEDVYPTHYRVNSSQQIRALAKATGFRIAEYRSVLDEAGLVMIPPLLALEVVWMRLLMTRIFRGLRPNLICAFEKGRCSPSVED